MITKEELKRLREEFPAGCRVMLLQMNDEQAPPPGTTGTVDHVDDVGTIHVKWNNGSGLGVVHGADSCIRVEDTTPPRPKKHRVEVTCEITYRRSFEVELDDENYENLLEGNTQGIDDLFENVECHKDSDYERDYAVFDLDRQMQVVDWN